MQDEAEKIHHSKVGDEIHHEPVKDETTETVEQIKLKNERVGREARFKQGQAVDNCIALAKIRVNSYIISMDIIQAIDAAFNNTEYVPTTKPITFVNENRSSTSVVNEKKT